MRVSRPSLPFNKWALYIFNSSPTEKREKFEREEHFSPSVFSPTNSADTSIINEAIRSTFPSSLKIPASLFTIDVITPYYLMHKIPIFQKTQNIVNFKTTSKERTYFIRNKFLTFFNIFNWKKIQVSFFNFSIIWISCCCKYFNIIFSL